MAQRKILVDTCVYLRLARYIHPLLQNEFGSDRYCLYVIPEFDQEYSHQPRLHQTHPWVNETEYQENRTGELNLSRTQKAGADQTNKKLVVPRLPLRIGMITSRETAAYYDVYHTLEQGVFAYRVSFADATMQGDQAATSIRRGLKLFETLNTRMIFVHALHSRPIEKNVSRSPW